MYLLESPRRGDSNEYTKRIIHNKKNCSKVSNFHAFGGSISSFLYNSKFDLTANLLVTNSVVITRVHCILKIIIVIIIMLPESVKQANGCPGE